MAYQRIILLLAFWLGSGYAFFEGLPTMSEANMTAVEGAAGYFDSFDGFDADLEGTLDKRQRRCRPGTRM